MLLHVETDTLQKKLHNSQRSIQHHYHSVPRYQLLSILKRIQKILNYHRWDDEYLRVGQTRLISSDQC